MNFRTMPTQTKPFLWGVATGALALLITGFGWGGWVSGSQATKIAGEHADAALVTALTPICVDQFQRSANASANLAELKGLDRSWDQRKYVSEGGWATMPGSTKKPDRNLAAACAKELDKIVL